MGKLKHSFPGPQTRAFDVYWCTIHSPARRVHMEQKNLFFKALAGKSAQQKQVPKIFSVHVLSPQVFKALIHVFFLCNENAEIHTITLIFTIHYLNSGANGSLITPITFTDSFQSHMATKIPTELAMIRIAAISSR